MVEGWNLGEGGRVKGAGGAVDWSRKGLRMPRLVAAIGRGVAKGPSPAKSRQLIGAGGGQCSQTITTTTTAITTTPTTTNNNINNINNSINQQHVADS